MRHEPCAAIRNLQHSVKLVGTNALLAGAEQMIRQEPLAERNVAVSEDRSHGDGKLLAASTTFPRAFASMFVVLGIRRLQAVCVIQFAAMRADRAFGPTLRF